MNAVFYTSWVFYFDIVKDFYLCFCLVSVFVIVFNYLQGHLFSFFMIHTFIDLPK